MSFVHLHVHTEYSTLDGIGRVKELVAMAKKLGQDSLAITDHRNLYGLIQFSLACKEAGIKAIIGCEIEETEDRTIHTRKEMEDKGYDNYHLVLLARNDEGLQNLFNIVSDAATIGNFDRKERSDLSILRANSKGIIALSACLGGRVQQLLLKGDYQGAKVVAETFQSIFDEFYLELQCSEMLEQKMINAQLVKLSEETGIPLVITRDVHYVLPSDADIHDTILCVQTSSLKNDANRFKFQGQDYYLCNEQEIRDYLQQYNLPLSALHNTRKIADACNVTVQIGRRLMPQFPVPAGFTEESYLRKLAFDGLDRYAQRKSIDVKMHIERIEEELRVICDKGFAGYFLILEDIVNFCRAQDITIGAGRGSAAGCLLSYLIGITKINPLPYGLMFERFLNPERDSFPDIDMDFDYNRREEVIDYICQRYGRDRVAQIITFGTIGVKGGVKDIMRALGYPYIEAENITKNVPDKMPDQSEVTYDKLIDIATNPESYRDAFEKKLDKIVEASQEFLSAMNQYPDVRQVLERTSGIVRHVGIHAAGVIITPGPTVNYIPVCRGPAKAVLNVSQWDLATLDVVGALKMDILALKYLSVVDMTKKFAGITVDVDEMEPDDPAVYRDLREGHTHGIFQLGSSGITHLTKQVKPFEFNDIIDILALYRPGPLEARMENGLTMVEQYVENKNNLASLQYEHPDLRPILQSSKGVFIYQEQIMAAAQKFGGYTLGGADIFRKLMGKKQIEYVEPLRSPFIQGVKEVVNPDGSKKLEPTGNPGAVALGYSSEFANHLFDMMAKFSGLN